MCPFAECTVAPHLHDWTGSFAEDIHNVLITLNVMMKLQIHSATYLDMKPALLSRCPLPLYRLLPPPSRPHPCTPRDPLLHECSVLSNHFRRIPLHHRNTLGVAFRLFKASTGAKANPEGFRQEPTLKVWQTFRYSASFLSVFSIRTDTLSWFLADEAAATYSRFSCQQSGQQLWSVSKPQVLARIRSSSFGQQCSSRECGSCCQTPRMWT